MAVTLTQEMINGAIQAQKKYNVPASVTLGQIMLESGGSYPGGLSGLAYNDNNLFGIKAGSSWTGQKVSYKTYEYNSSGQKYQTTAYFRKYASVTDSIDDHGKLLASPTYTKVTAGKTNLDDYVRAMGGVYATSPTYADNLLKIIKDNNLTKYDTMDVFTGSPVSTTTNTSVNTSADNQTVSALGGIFGTLFVVGLTAIAITVVLNMTLKPSKKSIIEKAKGGDINAGTK